MSNIYTAMLLNLVPMSYLPVPLGNEFWDSNPERKLLADDLRKQVGTGDYTMVAEEESNLLRLVSYDETGSYAFVAEVVDQEVEYCEMCETHHPREVSYILVMNGHLLRTFEFEKGAMAALDGIVRENTDAGLPVREHTV